VISKRQCPHTGIVNFFLATDPLIAVGSLSQTAAPVEFAWRCYLDDEVSGLAADKTIAEARLRQAIARRRLNELDQSRAVA
jgi:hypothetical protein